LASVTVIGNLGEERQMEIIIQTCIVSLELESVVLVTYISALQELREVTLMYGLLNERVPGLEKMNITKGEVISAQAKVNSATYHQRPNHHARTTMTSDFMLFSTQLSIMM